MTLHSTKHPTNGLQKLILAYLVVHASAMQAIEFYKVISSEDEEVVFFLREHCLIDEVGNAPLCHKCGAQM